MQRLELNVGLFFDLPCGNFTRVSFTLSWPLMTKNLPNDLESLTTWRYIQIIIVKQSPNRRSGGLKFIYSVLGRHKKNELSCYH